MIDLQREKNSRLIKKKAQELGFDFCGIAKAQYLEEEAPRLERWLKDNHHGEMSYMGNWFDKRLDPRKLVDNAKSVICCLYNYHTNQKQSDPDAPIISKYAYGKDYHYILKPKLKELMDYIREEIGEVNGRAFVDSAPVWERVWAARAGLGWIGKNTNLINKNQGSYFFLGELVIDLELECDQPFADHCAKCVRCIEACPTDAIIEPYLVDGSKCISYFTIELRDKIPEVMTGKFANRVFGCDICQDVCPFNKRAKEHNESAFKPANKLMNLTAAEWQELDKESYQDLFRHSAVKRTKYSGLKRNIEFLQKK